MGKTFITCPKDPKMQYYREVCMGKTFITCPKDPKTQYYREVCIEIFRKGNMRNWCKNCEVFQEQKKTTEETQ